MGSHERKCWDCGNVAQHASRVTPAVLCRKCGSQDTRATQRLKIGSVDIPRGVFSPHWPEGLEARKFYEIPCDDDGRSLAASMSVMIAEDGDVHVSMSKFSDDPRSATRSKANMNPFPSIRIRTMQGGGRNSRTRQALLWLAEAIRLDNIDNPQNEARHIR